MSFNGIQYCFFLPCVVVVYWMLRRSSPARMLFLLAASYYFYMSWNWHYAGLMLLTTVLDYVMGRLIDRAADNRARKLWLTASVAGNLGILFVFKYYNFFADSMHAALACVGLSVAPTRLEVLLPVGVSFYTFQSMSYTIDVYRRQIRPADSFAKFALFVSFFPQLVAGPIVRASEFLPQLDRPRAFDDGRAVRGVGLILLGLFKKICIADVLAGTLVDGAFADPAGMTPAQLWLALYGYAFQIYYDFSGYSDIAIGSAALLGFELPINFDRPYLATDIRDFWRRWHISLSTWLRDYLYIPLGGGRGSALKVARNLAITMLLGGLWHGAAWGFVLWGAYHGLLLGINRRFRRGDGAGAPRDPSRCPRRALATVATFHLVCLGWLLFRSPDLATCGAFLSRMFSTGRLGEIDSAFMAALLAGVALEVAPRSLGRSVADAFAGCPSIVRAGAATCMLLLFAALSGGAAPFIYFQF